LNKPLESTKSLDDVLKIPVGRAVMHRLPWLLIGLGGGVFAARIVEGFQATLSENLFLASFIPLIVYMSDAVGTQMEAFAIRDLAIKSHLHFIKYFIKQFLVVSVIGVILSTTLLLISLLTSQELQVGLVLSIMSSLATGLLVPYIFARINFDPANASGPIATIIQDLLSVSVYFAIANSLLS
jgi:magnesium transporter